MTSELDLLIAIQNRHTEANAAVVNAVAALQQQLAEHTATLQKTLNWHPVDSGGVSGGSFDVGSVAVAADWISKGRVGGDMPPGYKSITMGLSSGIWYADAGGTIPLGVVARIRYAVEDQFQSEVLVDIPANGLLSVPLCAGEATVDFLLTQIAFTATQMQTSANTPQGAFASGVGWPNFPQPSRLSLANVNSSQVLPRVSLGMSAQDSIGRTANTLPSRKVTVHVASGEGGFLLYIPKGTQAFVIQGPSDGAVVQQDVGGNFPINRISSPVVFNVTTQLIPGVQALFCTSSAGGFFTASFFLGT